MCKGDDLPFFALAGTHIASSACECEILLVLIVRRIEHCRPETAQQRRYVLPLELRLNGLAYSNARYRIGLPFNIRMTLCSSSSSVVSKVSFPSPLVRVIISSI